MGWSTSIDSNTLRLDAATYPELTDRLTRLFCDCGHLFEGESAVEDGLVSFSACDWDEHTDYIRTSAEVRHILAAAHVEGVVQFSQRSGDGGAYAWRHVFRDGVHTYMERRGGKWRETPLPTDQWWSQA